MLSRVQTEDERGAVAVIVAVLLAALTLPLLAFVIDTGGLYVERRQLQHGADAGAMAVALSCATSCTEPSSRGLADSYADGNTSRGADLDDDTVAPVCGTVGSLPACPPPAVAASVSPYDCESTPPPGTDYVQVRVDSAGDGWQRFFSGDTTDVSACARVRTDAPLRYVAGGVPVTMSICEWAAATSGGTAYAPPPATPPAYSPAQRAALLPYERIILLQAGTGSRPDAPVDETDPTGCRRGPANQFVPGGFGWLDGPGCTATIVDGVATGGTGSREERECRSVFDALVDARQPLYIPVHDTVVRTGRTFEGLNAAGFVMTGYNLASGRNKQSWVSRSVPNCPGSGEGKCISGFFTRGLAPIPGEAGTGTSFGASTVARIP